MNRTKWFYLLLILVFTTSLFTRFAAHAQGTGPVLAFTAIDGDIYFYHLDGSGLERITTDGHLKTDPAAIEIEIEYQNLNWSPDGRYLAAVRQQAEPQPDRMVFTTTLMIYDLQTHSWRQTGKDLTRFAWNPTSTGVVYGLPITNWSGKGQAAPPYNGIFQYDLTNGQETEILSARERPLHFPSYSRTGRYLVSYEVIGMEGLGYFSLYDNQTGTYRVWGQDTNFAAASLNWSKEDTFVVFDQNTYSPSSDSKIYRASPSFEDVIAISPQVDGRIFFSPRLSPTEDRVAALSDPNPDTATGPIFTTIWVFNLDGSNAREVAAPQSSLYMFAWADGHHLIYSSGDYRRETIQMVDVDNGKTELLGRGREFALQPGAAVPPAQETATPLQVSATIQPGAVIQVLTATPAVVVQPTQPVPPDRVVPAAPAWLTPRLLVILACGGSLLALAVVGGLVILLRKR